MTRYHRFILGVSLTAFLAGISHSAGAPVITPSPVSPPISSSPGSGSAPIVIDNDLTNHAYAYLEDLQATPGAIADLQALTGIVFPAQGAQLSAAQFQTLYGMMFNADGSHSSAYTNPLKSAQSLPPALTALQVFQKTPGAISTLETLTGQILPTTGSLLTTTQIQFLYTQLFDANGNPQTAYTNPTKAAEGLQPALTYLLTLQKTPGALTALQELTGNSLPATGDRLTTPQIQFLYTQLFDASGNTQTAYTNPTAAAQAIQPALTYLQTLQQTPGALTALQALTGNSLPTTGTLLSTVQLQFLYTQLFDASGKQQTAYTNPTAAAQGIQPALTYLQTLQQTPGGSGRPSGLDRNGFADGRYAAYGQSAPIPIYPAF